MARKIFPNTVAGRLAAETEPAVDGKKEVSVNAKEITVLTGSDVPASPRSISVETFRDRFTSAELKAIASSTDADIKCALLKLSTKEVSSLLDLDKDEVVNTMAKLVSLGLITPARSAVITA